MKLLLIIQIVFFSSFSLAQPGYVYFADASREKKLVDEYIASYDDKAAAFLLERKILSRLFDTYAKEVYHQTLVYLQSLAAEHPEAVMTLSDSIQSYWDSHYLQSYLVGNSEEYGKLKFLSALGMAVGSIGLLKNPLAPIKSLRSLNFLLPLAGGAGSYYAVRFFSKSLANVPTEPQEILSFAQGERYFSYQQKRNDYLYRLFSVGIGLGSSEFIFKKLIGKKDDLSLFKPKWKKSYLIGTIGAILGFYAIHKVSHYLMHTAEIKKRENDFKDTLQDLYEATHNGDREGVIAAAQNLTAETLKLVTLYEIKHLHAIVEFEKEFSKEAAQLAMTDEDIQKKLEELTTKLSKSLAKKLKRAIRKDYHYDQVPLLKTLGQTAYQDVIANAHLSGQEYVAEITRGFMEKVSGEESDAEIDEKFSSYIDLILGDKYAEAKVEIDNGKLQKNIELLFQVATVFKTLGEDKQFSFLHHFHHKLLAKFQKMLLMYQNFDTILDHNKIWQIKFTAAELKTAIDVYLDYHKADRGQNTQGAQLPGGTSRKVLTSTRGFSRFLAGYIATMKKTKDYNYLILHILSTYQQEPQHREALAVLIKDIADKAELHGGYYDSVWAEGIKGGFGGGFLLMTATGIANLLHTLGVSGEKAPFRWVSKLLNTKRGKLWNFAGMSTDLAALKRLGIVAAIGAGVGVAYYYLKKLQTHKLHPKAALLETQKFITLDLAHRACLLWYEVEASEKDISELKSFNADQIQRERDVYAKLIAEFQILANETNHLHKFAGQLRVNHEIDLEDLERFLDSKSEGQCLPQTPAAVSLTPLTEDLQRAGTTLNNRKKALDAIEYRRLTQELDT